jgi:hypothetical protein
MSEADARARRLQQEVDELDAYNMERLQVESEALDLMMEISPHQKKQLPDFVQDSAVRDHLDPLIIPTKRVLRHHFAGCLILNPIQSHLNSLVQVDAGAQLPPFCLVTQDLPSMWLDRIKVVAGYAGPSTIGKPSAQSGTKPLLIPVGRLREKRLKEIKEGILQHNQECRDVQERLNRERQQLHRVAVR